MQEADRHRFHRLALERRNQRLEFRLFEGRQLLAVGRHPAAHFQTQPPLDQGGRLVEEQIVDHRRADPAQLEHVAKTLGGHQCCAGAAPLEDGVGRHRGAVGHRGYLASRDPVDPAQLGDGIEHRLLEVGRRGQHLVALQRSVIATHDDVGERPADVSGDPERGHLGMTGSISRDG